MTEAEWLVSEDPAAMLAWLCEVTGSTYGGPTEYDRKPSERKLRLFGVACWERYRRRGYLHPIGSRDRDAFESSVRLNLLWIDGEIGQTGENTWSLHTLPAGAFAQSAIQGYTKAGIVQRQGHMTPAGLAGNRQRLPVADAANLLREIIGNPFRPVTLPPGPPAQCLRCEGDGWNPSEDGWGARDTCKVCNGVGTLPLFGPCPWLTPIVVSLAESAYRDRREDGTLDPLTLLAVADALEEAGAPTDTEQPCPTCREYRADSKLYGPGYHPERDVASGQHEGGWTNCKTCNSGGPGQCRPGFVRVAGSPLLAHLRGEGPHVRGCAVIDLLLGKE